MISKHNIYDYEKVFFRRPIFSELNVLFFKTLLLTILIFGLFISIMAIGFYRNYSPHQARNQVKQNYFTQLVAFYENAPKSQFADAAPDTETNFGNSIYEYAETEFIDSEFANIIELNEPETETASIHVFEPTAAERAERDRFVPKEPENGIPEFGVPTATGENYDNSLVAFLPSSSQTGSNMRNAIGDINEMAKPVEPERNTPMQPYNTRKKAYEASARLYSQTQGNKVDIGGTEFTNFEIIKGTRNYEETIGVANENSLRVKPCLERIYRKYPTLKGQFTVEFDVHPDGYVIPSSIVITKSDIQDVQITSCIKRSIRRWKNFPKVDMENGIYSMTQKFVF